MSENAIENFDDAHAIVETSAQNCEQSLSAAVVTAVADAADADPAELGTRLYDCIDPDALDNLFADRYDGRPRGGGGHVVFSLLDYEVTVYSDGHVVVRG